MGRKTILPGNTIQWQEDYHGRGLTMKNLPLSIQTFRDFIEQDYIYVDKTKPIHDLFARGGKYYFLSRPRRFGKSVLISTLAEIFSGNKELFKGLWIYDKIQWTSNPIIHMDFSKIDYETPNKLKESIKKFLNKTAISHGLTLDEKKTFKESFVELIEKLSTKGRVVILIDEYDKPLIEYIEVEEIETAKKIRKVLKNFYDVIKGMDAYLRFVFITGVSKFTRVSVFSDLNNLIDITLARNYSTLLGYTEMELRHYFSSYLQPMAEKQGMSSNDLIDIIREWYNGYSWDGENFVYNPFSILNLFNTSGFKNFWFSTGTPTFLIKLIKNRQSDLMEFENLPVKGYTFDSNDLESMDIAGLLFQTGYLTVKKITIKDQVETYHLSYPNREVRNSFLTYILGDYMQKDMNVSARGLERITDAIQAGDIDRFIQEIKSLLASVPFHIFMSDKEAYYHSLIYLILSLSGAAARCEDPTNRGRIDAVLETAKKIYIMEFKMGNEREALKQIKEMKYYEKYLASGKEIVLLGIGFDPGNRNIGNYLTENT
ncbi:MAG TPA: AAA family ATPase [Candidatus Kapabacteria bacterium]|nr:AAA family ATPase [Candidatus Kapabacteria bacterium]